MNYKKTAGYLLSLSACVALSANIATAQMLSSFDNDAEGWRACDINPLIHLQDFPVSSASYWQNGMLRVGDVYSWTFITAPTRYLGNWSSGYGGTIEYDIRIAYTDGVPYPAIVLQGQTKTIYYVRPTPQVGVTETHTATIAPGNWKLNSYLGPAATETDIRDVLKHVVTFSILTEWNTGPDDTIIDSISISFTPQLPGGISILGRSLMQKPASSTPNKYLFKCWGEVTGVYSNYFRLDDGSLSPLFIYTDVTGIQAGQKVIVRGYKNFSNAQNVTAPREWVTFY